MTNTKAYAAFNNKEELKPHDINRRTPGPNDVHQLLWGLSQ